MQYYILQHFLHSISWNLKSLWQFWFAMKKNISLLPFFFFLFNIFSDFSFCYFFNGTLSRRLAFLFLFLSLSLILFSFLILIYFFFFSFFISIYFTFFSFIHLLTMTSTGHHITIYFSFITEAALLLFETHV